MGSKPDTSRLVRLFLLVTTLYFYVSAVVAPDRGQMLSGLRDILLSPAQTTKDYFFIGSMSATFLNLALVGSVCVALTFLPGAVCKGSTIAAFFLTMGFSTWGINILNIWPFMLGAAACTLLRRQRLGAGADIIMFSTGLCPLVSEMLLRYPGDQVHAITPASVLLALAVGFAIGFLTPAIAAHSPNLHKGFDLYSAALAAGLLGFFAVAMLYKTAGYTVPAPESMLGESRPVAYSCFLGIFFIGCIVAGFFLNGKSAAGYINLLRDSGHKVDFTAKYGMGLSLFNFGVYGLFIMAYYVLIGGSLNGVTCGLVLCMVCFGAAGSHPLNVWPIMAGYILASLVGASPINNQGIMAGLCYASGLAPFSGVYGWWAGVVAGAAHYTLVTSVPALHGNFCLYNGGFTALLVAVILAPQMEMFFKPKAERLAARPGKKR